MENSSLILDGQKRVPLGLVVSDCAKRWFQDTLKEAKTGDITMQVLVGQMYFNGYGVPKDVEKVYLFLSLIVYFMVLYVVFFLGFLCIGGFFNFIVLSVVFSSKIRMQPLMCDFKVWCKL
jgi:hypothetical protein